jgi:hypothetical protein
MDWMMRGRTVLWSVVLPIGLLSANVFTRSASGAEPVTAPASVRNATVAKLVPQCPTTLAKWSNPSAPATESAFLLPLIAPVAGVAIEKGVSFAAQWLKRSQDDLSATSSARDVSTMYLIRDDGKLSARNGCLIFLRAELGPQAEFDKRVQAGVIGKDPIWTASHLSILRDGWENEQRSEEGEARRGRIALLSAPVMYAEFAIRYNNTSSAKQFNLRPVFFDYRATAAERQGRGNKDILFTIAFDRSDESTSPVVFAKYDLVLAKTPVGAQYGSETLADIVGRPQNLPAQSGNNPVAVNVTVSMLETEKAGDLERLLAETIDENKDKLGAAISARIQHLLAPNTEQK